MISLKSNRGKLKILYIVLLIVIVLICALLFMVISGRRAAVPTPEEMGEKDNSQEDYVSMQPKPINELVENYSSEDVSRAVSIGIGDNKKLCLIFPDLSSKDIYTREFLYSPEYFVKDNIIYVIYEELGFTTAYVDIINLNTREAERVIAEEIKNGNPDKDITVYYTKYVNDTMWIMSKNLKENTESEYKDITDKALRDDSESELILDNNSRFNISDDKKIVFYNDRAIYQNTDEGHVSYISLIDKNVLQITVEHLGSHNGGIVWYPDEYQYYYINEDKLVKLTSGYSDIKLLNK